MRLLLSAARVDERLGGGVALRRPAVLQGLVERVLVRCVLSDVELCGARLAVRVRVSRRVRAVLGGRPAFDARGKSVGNGCGVHAVGAVS